MLEFELPLLQTKESPPFTVSVVLSPSQIERFPLISGFGLSLTVTIALADAVQPAPFATTTV